MRYTATQIYAFARQAGFTPDQSATMTAIALAESGGDPQSHNTHGEDSRGLWQINAAAHPDLGQSSDLFDPVQNAKAAFLVSHGGADVSPWTTTHGDLAAPYMKFKDVAQAAAVANGDAPGLGVWTGTPGYGHELAAGSSTGRTVAPAHGAADGSESVVVAHNTPQSTLLGTGGTGTRAGEAYGIPLDEADPRHGAEFGIPLDQPDAADATTAVGTDGTGAAGGDGTGAAGADATAAGGTAAESERTHKFLAAALAQTGDKYVFGAEARLDDPNPSAFDCSELVQWASHQAGVDVVDNAWMQYRQMHAAGTIIPVEQAIHTPGALLFSFNTDPNGSTAPGHQHVAISLGTGKTIEALGAKYGVGSFDATTKRFQYAALIPGMSDPPAEATTVGETVGIVVPPPAAPAPDPTHADPPPDPHPTPPPAAPDDFDKQLAHDPDHLDTPPGPAADDGTPDPAADHTDHVVDTDVNADGLDDSMAPTALWPGGHPPGGHPADGYHHDGHDDVTVH